MTAPSLLLPVDHPRRQLCIDCRRDTIDMAEYYMVRDELWASAVGHHEAGMCCIDCLEGRLGRRLTPADFADAPINKGKRERRSPLLKRRMVKA